MSSGAGDKGGARLGVLVDGTPLSADEAKAIWLKFSAYMEANKGDLAGFAKAEGFKSVHPRSDVGRALLVFSRTDDQEAYGTVRPVSLPAGGRPSSRQKRQR